MEDNLSIPPVAEEPPTPLEFLETVYACNELPLQTRMRAAIAAAQFRHPKLSAVADLTRLDIGTQLQRAWAARQKVLEERGEFRPKYYRGGPRLIEGEVIKEREPT
jgi:hypothetical protein